MLLIDCPYCGKRPESEFRYGGEAHIARPGDPAALDDAAWGEFLYQRSNRAASIASGGAMSMAAPASSTRCATRRAT